MAANPIVPQPAVIEAELLEDESGQIFRVPEAFRFKGKQVRIRQVPQGILIEPANPKARKWTKEEVQELSDRMDARSREFGPFMPGGRNQPPMQERDFPW